jgi:5-methylcytosine-specific restriction endonuclease McrA
MPMATPEEQREYNRLWVANRRLEWIEENGPCVKCSSWDDLQVDHVDPREKLYNISQGIWSMAKNNPIRIKELDKCQVLCEPCHKEKTRENSVTQTHGTFSMYERHRCRCEQCRAWKSEKNSRRIRSGSI